MMSSRSRSSWLILPSLALTQDIFLAVSFAESLSLRGPLLQGSTASSRTAEERAPSVVDGLHPSVHYGRRQQRVDFYGRQHHLRSRDVDTFYNSGITPTSIGDALAAGLDWFHLQEGLRALGGLSPYPFVVESSSLGSNLDASIERNDESGLLVEGTSKRGRSHSTERCTQTLQVSSGSFLSERLSSGGSSSSSSSTATPTSTSDTPTSNITSTIHAPAFTINTPASTIHTPASTIHAPTTHTRALMHGNDETHALSSSAVMNEDLGTKMSVVGGRARSVSVGGSDRPVNRDPLLAATRSRRLSANSVRRRARANAGDRVSTARPGELHQGVAGKCRDSGNAEEVQQKQDIDGEEVLQRRREYLESMGRALDLVFLCEGEAVAELLRASDDDLSALLQTRNWARTDGAEPTEAEQIPLHQAVQNSSREAFRPSHCQKRHPNFREHLRRALFQIHDRWRMRAEDRAGRRREALEDTRHHPGDNFDDARIRERTPPGLRAPEWGLPLHDDESRFYTSSPGFSYPIVSDQASLAEWFYHVCGGIVPLYSYKDFKMKMSRLTFMLGSPSFETSRSFGLPRIEGETAATTAA
ncbi:unnamed protein product [Amoebophrya sp. A25]|nr:unnamed protein product [Amoebophrya sp. A25]|eukprot:GSA25T00013066001.1